MYGVSEEVEECIFDTSVKILETTKNPLLRSLSDSCLHSRSQQNSVEFLKEHLKKLSCIETPADVFQHLATLDRKRMASCIGLSYTIDKEGILQLLINGSPASIPLPFYFSREKLKAYKSLLKTLGNHFDQPNLESIIRMEKGLLFKLENTWSPQRFSCKGLQLLRKFPTIPWASWFAAYGIEDWKTKLFYYSNPQYIRFMGRMLKEISIPMWKLYIARIYILSMLQYLPPPFDELHFDFFRKSAQGQKQKQPQKELLVNIVYNYCGDLFSKLFWETSGSKEVEKMGKPFVEQLQQAAIDRLEETEWMQKSTKDAAILKMKKLNIEVVRPREWSPAPNLTLDPKNLVKNIFALGEEMTKVMFSRIGKSYTFWEEGVYRVNAYYFTENNEIMIPYGTMLPPYFMESKQKIAWNLGGLGTIIGHEMCHAFDDDGRCYDERGQMKKWWTRKDLLDYKRKSKQFITLFNSIKLLGKKINGTRTLSENIADNGGIAISLQALKNTFTATTTEEEKKEMYRDFFTSYAVSWRTKIRNEKLLHALETDRHSPASVRVNYVVNQYDEWYDAFDIQKGDALWIPNEERLRLF